MQETPETATVDAATVDATFAPPAPAATPVQDIVDAAIAAATVAATFAPAAPAATPTLKIGRNEFDRCDWSAATLATVVQESGAAVFVNIATPEALDEAHHILCVAETNLYPIRYQARANATLERVEGFWWNLRVIIKALRIAHPRLGPVPTQHTGATLGNSRTPVPAATPEAQRAALLARQAALAAQLATLEAQLGATAATV